MISLAAQSIVFLIGVFVSVFCAWGCFVPDKLMKLVVRVMRQVFRRSCSIANGWRIDRGGSGQQVSGGF